MIDPEIAAHVAAKDLPPLMIKCLNSLCAEIRQLDEKLDAITEAFPDGYLSGHRRYHEAVIESMETRNKIVRECLVKAGAAGFIGGLGWLGWALWNWLKLGLR